MQHADELGVKAVPFTEMVYLEDEDRYEETGKLQPGARTRKISGTQVRNDYLGGGRGRCRPGSPARKSPRSWRRVIRRRTGAASACVYRAQRARASQRPPSIS